MQIADHHETHGFSELLVQAVEDGRAALTGSRPDSQFCASLPTA